MPLKNNRFIFNFPCFGARFPDSEVLELISHCQLGCPSIRDSSITLRQNGADHTYSYNCNRIMHVSFEQCNYISWPLSAGYRDPLQFSQLNNSKFSPSTFNAASFHPCKLYAHFATRQKIRFIGLRCPILI